MKSFNQNKGFTLLEVLLVVAALAILAGIVIVAINPGKQLGDTRNTERRSHVTTVLNAVHQYGIDNDGVYPSDIDTDAASVEVLGTATTGCDLSCGGTTAEAACVDLSDELVPDYIVGIPSDPQASDATISEYYINRDANGRIVVGACTTEQGATIEVTQ